MHHLGWTTSVIKNSQRFGSFFTISSVVIRAVSAVTCFMKSACALTNFAIGAHEMEAAMVKVKHYFGHHCVFVC